MKKPEDRSLREIIEESYHGEPSVYLVRHGATTMNRGGAGKDLIRGWANVPLSKLGIEEADRSTRIFPSLPTGTGISYGP